MYSKLVSYTSTSGRFDDFKTTIASTLKTTFVGTDPGIVQKMGPMGMNPGAYLPNNGGINNQVSNGKTKTAHGCLGYLRDYTTQLYRDHYKPL